MGLDGSADNLYGPAGRLQQEALKAAETLVLPAAAYKNRELQQQQVSGRDLRLSLLHLGVGMSS